MLQLRCAPGATEGARCSSPAVSLGCQAELILGCCSAVITSSAAHLGDGDDGIKHVNAQSGRPATHMMGNQQQRVSKTAGSARPYIHDAVAAA